MSDFLRWKSLKSFKELQYFGKLPGTRKQASQGQGQDQGQARARPGPGQQPGISIIISSIIISIFIISIGISIISISISIISISRPRASKHN